MMKWIAYGLAVACTALALVVPWVHYGGMEFGLTRFPGWPIYVVGALALHACTWWNATIGRALAAAGGLVALITAVVLMLRYDEAGLFFDGPVIPAVAPGQGLGGFLAVAGALLNLALVATARAGARGSRRPSPFVRAS